MQTYTIYYLPNRNGVEIDVNGHDIPVQMKTGMQTKSRGCHVTPWLIDKTNVRLWRYWIKITTRRHIVSDCRIELIWNSDICYAACSPDKKLSMWSVFFIGS